MAKRKAIALGLILLLSWLGTTITFSPTIASPDVVKWSPVNIPTEGESGNWVLASGSDVQHLTRAINGTLYAYGKGLTYTLYKSTDGGYNWSYTGKVNDAIVNHAIVDIATAPDNANVVFFATSSHVYKSTDGGSKFIALPKPPGTGSNNVEITSFDVTRINNYIIVVGTRDTDGGEYGGVYLLEEDFPFTWTDTNLVNRDVYAVAFSPGFPGDRQIVAVATDETDTWFTTKIGSAGWGATIANARLDKDNSGIPTPVAVDTSAAIAFPSDYEPGEDGSYSLFIAIDAGSDNGDVYKINRSQATDLNIGSAYNLNNIDVTGLVVSGSSGKAKLMAGAAESAQVYRSTDGGRNWTRSSKEPTGQSKTYVLMASDLAYVATSGANSAFSISQDNGVTWNQVGLIDTGISKIIDLAPSPGYSQDNTMFMLTHKTGGKHSLWRSLNGGARWEGVFSSSLADVDSIKLVALPPQYGSSQVVFTAGISGGNPAIWRSTDNGQSFDQRISTSFSIDRWAIVDDTTLFMGSFDGTNGQVYYSTNSGFTYSTGALVGTQSLKSIALSPNYKQDKTLLVGNSNGWVYWSKDNGDLFESLPKDATSPPLTGNITVAFDHKFDRNKTVYAASDTADKGVYRFIIGTDATWERIDSTLPAGGTIGQLRVSDDGTLYATNLKADGGMERSLNPTYQLGPKFETVTRGLEDGAKLSGLWLVNSQLWSIDSANIRLLAFTDSLTLPISSTLPPDKTAGMGMIINYTVPNVSLDWETLNGAISYTWQLDHDTDFTTVPTGFEGTTKASTARLPTLEPATTYYWRVRATEPVLSRWSAKWSFTTSFGTKAIAPKLNSPEPGATGMPIRPVFLWGAIATAESYELLVSTDASFTNPTVAKIDTYALPATAWECNIKLNYNTTYYWKVRATGAKTRSAWSDVSAFTTGSPPSPSPPTPTPSLQPPPSPPPSPPPPPAQQVTPDWVKWLIPFGGLLFLIILLMMMLMLITVIILVVKVVKL